MIGNNPKRYNYGKPHPEKPIDQLATDHADLADFRRSDSRESAESAKSAANLFQQFVTNSNGIGLTPAVRLHDRSPAGERVASATRCDRTTQHTNGHISPAGLRRPFACTIDRRLANGWRQPGVSPRIGRRKVDRTVAFGKSVTIRRLTLADARRLARLLWLSERLRATHLAGYQTIHTRI